MMQFSSYPKKNEDPAASLLELEAIRVQIFGHGVPAMWKF
jgi:hypothetical protein